MSNSVKGINLLPKEYIIEQKINFYEKIIGGILALELACFVVFVALPPKQEVVRTAQELEEKRAQLNSSKYAEVNKALEELADTKNSIDAWNEAYGKIKVAGYIDETLLDEITGRVPSGVYIETLSIEDTQEEGDGSKTISIEGSCEKTEVAQGYFAILETIFPASEMKTNAKDGEQNGKLGTFEVAITVKPEVKEVPEAETDTATAETTDSSSDGE